MNNPNISVCIPIHAMKNGEYFFNRFYKSLLEQTYKNYNLVVTEDGAMGKNLNSAIKKAKGDLIKIMCMDDWFAHPNALQDIVDNFTGDWMITGCDTNLHPYLTPDIHLGNNKLGGLSVITIKNDNPVLFDENLAWMIDIDYYKRMIARFGPPTILDSVNVNIGVGDHQSTVLLTQEQKDVEVKYMKIYD